MKTIKYFFVTIGLALCFLSCSKQEVLSCFDFGDAVYNEPFVGILRNRPSVLVKSLQYPPFSWVAPDTVKIKKNFDFSFNDECIRSKSEAIIQFKDLGYLPVKGITIKMNDSICPEGDFTIRANSKKTNVSLELVMSPTLGDTIFNGLILVQGKELDKANEVNLLQENNIVASWTVKQKIGWPILLWLLWLITAVLALTVVGFILYGIYWLYILLKTMLVRRKNISGKKRPVSYKNQKEKKRKEKEDWRKEIKRITGWSDIIINALNSKAEAEIYITAGLEQAIVGGRFALINPHIDWRAYNCRKKWLKEKLADWNKWKDYNNADLIGEGYPPRDENGDPYELHHIGQRQDSPFAELSWEDHMDKGHNKILHPKRESEIDRQLFDKEKSQYWINRFKLFTEEELKTIYKK